jgi:hypothetical protein
MKLILRSCFLLGCAVGVSSLAMAQETGYSFFTASAGAGFTTPAYGTGMTNDMGWNAQGQAGINFFGGHVGLVGEFDYDHMGINSTTLTNLGVPGGGNNLWGWSAEPVVRFRPNARLSMYLIGGPGIWHDNITLTAPSTGTVITPIGPVGVTNNIVLASDTVYRLGATGGAGFTFRLGSGKGKFFAEARYAEIYTRPATTWVPVTFGFRW